VIGGGRGFAEAGEGGCIDGVVDAASEAASRWRIVGGQTGTGRPGEGDLPRNGGKGRDLQFAELQRLRRSVRDRGSGR
jgi:hypothetical protein